MATKCRSVCLHLGLHKEFSHAQTYLQNSVLKLFAKPQSYSCSPDDVMSSGSWFTPPSILWLQAAKEFVAGQHVPQAWKTDLKEQANNDETADPFSFGLAVFTFLLFWRLFEKTLEQLPLLLTFVTDAQSLSCNVCHNCLTRWSFELHIACSVWTQGYARLHWSLSPSLLILFPTIWIEDLVSRYIAWAGVFLPAHLVSISPAIKCKKSCHKRQYVTARLV